MNDTLYHDNDFNVCRWLGELVTRGYIPTGRVECSDIATLDPATCLGTFHAFAGIGGWAYALQLAGWPADRSVWTGSCPCQPFSCAGRGKGTADKRHLWPAWFRLIRERRPATIFGEQVASPLGREWLVAVRLDLEALGYAVGACGLCAYAVGAPHKRLRTFWVAHTASNGPKGLQQCPSPQISEDWSLEALDAWHGTGHPFEQWEKLLAQSHVNRVDDGVSSTVDIRPRLHAYGNAIVPQCAALFIRAFLNHESGLMA